MNKENLLKFAETLERVAAMEKPEIKFDMGTYYAEDVLSDSLGPYLATHTEAPACGTVACALGLSGLAGFRARKDESWHEFAQRAYGVKGRQYDWCFGALWSTSDNTLNGAAKRLRYLVAKGGVPDEWRRYPWSVAHDPSYYMENGR